MVQDMEAAMRLLRKAALAAIVALGGSFAAVERSPAIQLLKSDVTASLNLEKVNWPCAPVPHAWPAAPMCGNTYFYGVPFFYGAQYSYAGPNWRTRHPYYWAQPLWSCPHCW